jgi:hypothetical protein
VGRLAPQLKDAFNGFSGGCLLNPCAYLVGTGEADEIDALMFCQGFTCLIPIAGDNVECARG